LHRGVEEDTAPAAIAFSLFGRHRYTQALRARTNAERLLAQALSMLTASPREELGAKTAEES